MSRGFGDRAGCQPVEELLSAYLDGEVDAEERARVVAHLETCESCRAELESLRATAGLLHNLPMAPAPRSFMIPAPEPRRSWVMRLVRPMRLATAAVVFVLAMVAGADFMGNQAIMTGNSAATYQSAAPTAQQDGQTTMAPSLSMAPSPGPAAATPQAAASPAAAGAEKAQSSGQAAAPLAATPPASSVTSGSEATPAAGVSSSASSAPSAAVGAAQTTPGTQAEGNAQGAQADSSQEQSGGSATTAGGAQESPSESSGNRVAGAQPTSPVEPAAAASLPEQSTPGTEIWFRTSEAVLVLIVVSMLAFLLIAGRLGGVQKRR